LIRGNIIKKHQQVYCKIQDNKDNKDNKDAKDAKDNKDDIMVTRNRLYIEHFLFTDDFDKNFEKYIKQLVVKN
jgi:hypothetical protein